MNFGFFSSFSFFLFVCCLFGIFSATIKIKNGKKTAMNEFDLFRECHITNTLDLCVRHLQLQSLVNGIGGKTNKKKFFLDCCNILLLFETSERKIKTTKLKLKQKMKKKILKRTNRLISIPALSAINFDSFGVYRVCIIVHFIFSLFTLSSCPHSTYKQATGYCTQSNLR